MVGHERDQDRRRPGRRSVQNARMIKGIHTEQAPFVRFSDGTEPPLSQAIVSGGLVFTSGQGPLDPATNEMPADFAAQVTQVLRNLVAVFEAAGSGKDRIIKCTCYLSDRKDFPAFNRVYREFFADSSPLPARTTVVTQLVREGVLVEIDAVAALAE
ncbi:RidA family protein [Streptomyces sp. ME19-01-6]|uniref:RidA family protein n=1 Tax=Streptomyces sp. ME19-01-6 TaxID=3028686 RepID=UPI0029A3F42E|nr:RidA family protein [Streptomyces sp. ME19-01-6]MDX3224758.1 RidA family protein [Streptomyces sp. ME19-01-6]